MLGLLGALVAAAGVLLVVLFRPEAGDVALAARTGTEDDDAEPAPLVVDDAPHPVGVRVEIQPEPVLPNALPESSPPTPSEVRSWVDDLRDDDVRGNAGWAMAHLRRAGRAIVPALEETLTSLDCQQRQLAAVLLREHDDPPSELLASVSVEALGREASRALVSTLAEPGAVGATRYLARHGLAARPALRFGLGSHDDQQRFLCAFLLACAGDPADADRVGRELIARLGDNGIGGDAIMAANGLYRLGRVAPFPVRSWIPYADEQARRLLELVARDLEAPPRNRRELAERSRMHDVTTVYHDPVLEFDVTRSRVPTW